MAKKQQTIVISTRDEADRALQRIGELQRFICSASDEAEENIADIRAELLKETQDASHAIAANEAALEAWAEANKKDLFTEPRSIDLNWGRIGFRLTPWKIKFLGKLKVETVLEKLRANKMTRLIRIEESVDKEKALNYDNETLEPLGMKKVHHDEFFYEVKNEEVK